MKKLILLPIWLLCLTSVTLGKEYKISTPEEFQHAAAAAKPGDEIILANGTYSGWATTVNIQGTTDHPVIIRAESPGKAPMEESASRLDRIRYCSEHKVHIPSFVTTGSSAAMARRR